MAFKLAKVLGGQANAHELKCKAPAGAIIGTAVDFMEGAPVYVSEKVIHPVGDDHAPTFFVEKTTVARQASDLVPLIKMLPDMVFEVPIWGDPSELNVGDRLQVYINSYVKKAPTKYEYGPILVDKKGATKSGDTVLVMFDRSAK